MKTMSMSRTRKLISFAEVIKDAADVGNLLLSEDEQEFFNERAAIMQYEGNLNRRQAERLALECTLKHRLVLAKVS